MLLVKWPFSIMPLLLFSLNDVDACGWAGGTDSCVGAAVIVGAALEFSVDGVGANSALATLCSGRDFSEAAGSTTAESIAGIVCEPPCSASNDVLLAEGSSGMELLCCVADLSNSLALHSAQANRELQE